MDHKQEPFGTVRRVDGVLTAEIDGELLMMSIEHGRYFNLNAVATRIWDLLAAPVSVEELVGTLIAEYDVTPVGAHEAVERFLQDLRERSLLVTDNAIVE